MNNYNEKEQYKMDGILNVYKEKGFTSFDVVAILRKKLNTKKVGHTGTLDPEAEGVLPICLGKATKTADYLMEKQKVYSADMLLGITTDTQDHTGRILQTREIDCTEEEIEKAIKSFVGMIDQIPPMYSAVKINGKKLYELARQGKVVERKSRRIEIVNIEDIEINIPRISFKVTCSKGTYIRTLCNDIGEKLLCGGHMTSLIREKSGYFEIQDSLKIDEIDNLMKQGRLEEFLIPIKSVFSHYPAVTIKTDYNKNLYNGNVLYKSYFLQDISLESDAYYGVFDEEKNFIGVYICNTLEEGVTYLRPKSLFISGVQ